MVVKRPTIPTTDQGPISRLYPLLTPNFLWQPERVCNAKGTKSKKAREKERKEARKKFGTGSQKSPNFGLFACTKLKHCRFLNNNWMRFL